MTVFLGIKLSDRKSTSVDFQRIISKYGCYIGARIGLPPKKCLPYGIILLEVLDNLIVENLVSELLNVDNIEIQRMVFN